MAICDGRIYDAHTLYIETGVAHRHQIEAVFKDAIEQLGVPCRFKVNVVETKEGYCGYSYVWVSSDRVYHALLGRNFDGSERSIMVDDPDWIPPEQSLEDALVESEAFHMSPLDRGPTSWADESNFEEEIEARYVCPQTKTFQDPLITVSGYIYDEEQLCHLIGLVNDQNESADSVPKQGFVVVYPAYVGDIDYDCEGNVLISRKIPPWIDDNILKQIFSDYASDPIKKVKRRLRDRNIMEPYPHVRIYEKNKVRTAFITFDPQTRDGQFALMMTRKLTLIDPNSSSSNSNSANSPALSGPVTNENETTLVFNFLLNRTS